MACIFAAGKKKKHLHELVVGRQISMRKEKKNKMLTCPVFKTGTEHQLAASLANWQWPDIKKFQESKVAELSLQFLAVGALSQVFVLAGVSQGFIPDIFLVPV